MRQELWKLCLCKLLIMGVKRATFMANRLQASFSYSFNVSLVQNRRLASIIVFLFQRLSRTTHSLIPTVYGYVGGFNVENSVVFQHSLSNSVLKHSDTFIIRCRGGF